MNPIRENTEDYPINLLDDIAGDEWAQPLPSDLLPSVEYTIATLIEREAKIIHMRYERGMTWEEIGSEYGFSKERARQIANKALRNLKHPSRMCWLTDGVQGVIAKREAAARQEAITKEFKEATKNIATIADAIHKAADSEVVQEQKQATAGHFENISAKLDKNISVLGLSNRAHMCVRKAGIQTVRELLDLPLDELSRIRGLGQKSYDEILDRVHGMGLKFKEEAKKK